MRVAIMLLLGACAHPTFDTSTFCGALQDVAHSATADFERIRGERRVVEKRRDVWTDPERIPGADSCQVVEPKSGQLFYSCDLPAAPCEIMESRFEERVHEMASCLGRQPPGGQHQRETDGALRLGQPLHPDGARPR